MSSWNITLVEFIGWLAQNVVNLLLQSTVLILAGLVVARLLNRHGAAVQSAIYRATLAAVLVCPLATMVWNGLGVEGWTIELPHTSRSTVLHAQPEMISPVTVRPVMLQDQVFGKANTETPEERAPAIDAGESRVGQPHLASIEHFEELPSNSPPVFQEPLSRADAEEATDYPAMAESYWFAFHSIIVFIWVVGTALLLMRLTRAYHTMISLQRRSALASATDQQLCSQMAELLNVRTPEVRRNPLLFSPCLTGIASPTILLPEEPQESIPLDKTFIHELAHLRRFDPLCNLIQRVALAFFFFQPLMWRLVYRLETTAEEVCDDYVVWYCSDRTGYAKQLIALAELDLTVPNMARLGMYKSSSSLLGHRVTRILDTNRKLTTHLSWPVLTNIVLLMVACAMLGGFLGNHQNPFARLIGPASPQVEEETIRFPSTFVNTRANGQDIVGKVVDMNGEPVEGATVLALGQHSSSESTFRSSGDEFWLSGPNVTPFEALVATQTNPGGEFTLNGSDVRSDSPVHVYHPKFAAYTWGTPDHTIVLTTGVTATGRILDPQGEPLAGVKVWASNISQDMIELGPYIHTVTTNSQGRFALPHCYIKDNNIHDPSSPLLFQHLKLRHPDMADAAVVWVPDSSVDFFRTDWPPQNQIRVGHFDYQMPATTELSLTGFNAESGVEIPLDFVELRSTDTFNFPYLEYAAPRKTGRGRYLVSPGEYDVACFPSAVSGLLGQQFRITIDPTEKVEKQVRFSAGCQISGRVLCGHGGEGIEGAPVVWLPEQPISEAGNDTRFLSTEFTDATGQFSLTVPAGKGVLAVLGIAKGYITVPNSQGLVFTFNPDSAYSRQFDLEDGGSTSGVEFQLVPAPKIKAQVTRVDGTAAASIAYYGSDVRSRYGVHNNSGTTDDHGSFTMNRIYSDATSFRGDAQSDRTNLADSSRRIAVVDPEKNEFALVDITPEPPAGSVVDMQIQLETAATLAGTVVCAATRNPVANAVVTVVLDDCDDFWIRWQTTTDGQGQYRLAGLLPDMPVILSVHSRLNGLSVSSDNKNLNTPPAGVVHEIQKIELKMPHALVMDNPLPKISGLELDRAIQEIHEFVNRQVQKMHLDESHCDSSAAPVNQFRNRVLKAISPLVTECNDRGLTPELEARLYVGIIEPLQKNTITWVPSRTSWFITARKKLESTLIDQPGVLPIIQRLLRSVDHPQVFKKILANTTRQDVEVWATLRLSDACWDSLTGRGTESVGDQTDEMFARLFQDFEDSLKMCAINFSDETCFDKNVGQMTQERIEHKLSTIPASQDKTRAEQLRQTLIKYLKKDGE